MTKKFLWSLLVLIGISSLVCVAPVAAITFQGTAVGSWINPDVTAADVWSISNNDAGGVASFHWGVPATTTFDNRFRFDGVGSDPGDSPWSESSESPFVIGSFDYRNGATTSSATVNGVDLNILLSITAPFGFSNNFAFDFSITNTPNNTGNPVTDGDIVAVTSSFSATTFSYLGIDYTLELLGFSSDGGVNIRSDFSSPEGATARADIYAKITSNIPAPVPEPATIILLGSGILGLAGYGRKRFKRK